MFKTQDKILSPRVSSHTKWSAINWHKVEKYVDKLQKRIYRAEINGEWRKVRNLQRILLNSNGALLLAIRRVTQKNKGKRTPGIDGFRALTDALRGELFDKMKYMNIYRHKPKPVSRTYIPKKNGKLRSLGIPVIIDRIYQELLRLALEPQAEVHFEPISYGFRPKRGAHDAIARIFINLRGGNWVWVFEGDFKSCFDNLDHDFILKQIKNFPASNVVERFLKAGYVDNNVFNRTNKGTPQGGIISPLLANIALTGLENYLNITYNEKYYTKGNYRVVRYADDFVIFSKTEKEIKQVRTLISPYLEERGLELAEDKTSITHATDGFDFLGFNCRLFPSKGKLKCIIKPSKDSLKNFNSKVRDIFNECKGVNVNMLISKLNPLIRGTSNYWRVSCASKTFNKADHYIWTKVKKFLKRLHPNKSWKWLRKTYFPFYNDGKHREKWILTDPIKGINLNKMAWTPIRRRIMIKYNYSPYDGSKEDYFAIRESKCYFR